MRSVGGFAFARNHFIKVSIPLSNLCVAACTRALVRSFVRELSCVSARTRVAVR